MDARHKEAAHAAWVTDQSSAQPSRSDASLPAYFLIRDDRAAFADLLARHRAMVRAVCWEMLHHWHDVENACQRSFAVAIRKAPSFDPRREFASWLHGIAVRVAWNIRRSKRRRQHHEGCCESCGSARPAQPADEAEQHETQEIVDAEVLHLQEKYRLPVILCCLKGKSKAEAAAELGLKEGTLSCRLARGRRLLQTRLIRRGIVPPQGRSGSGRA